MIGADAMVKCLEEEGVTAVFGYPGVAILNVYDELYKNKDRIKHILTAHEQGASHAADGYSRATGKTGVVLATSGPGATNLVTGIATAYMDSIPMVAITCNVTTPLLGKDSFQEVDITGITMPITKHSYIVRNIDQLAGAIREAFFIAQSGRPGPVLIDVPKDVTANVTDFEPLTKEELANFETLHLLKNIKRVNAGKSYEDSQIEEVSKLINSAVRPYIYAGGGIISSGACEEVKTLAEKEKNCTALKENIAELTTEEAVQREREVNAGESFISKNREFTDCADELKRLKNRAEEIERLLNLLSNEKEVSDKGMEIILFSHKSNLSKYESAQMRIAMLKKDLDFISLEEAEKELSLIPEGAISIGDLDELNERLIFKKQEEDILRQKIADDTARAANEFAFIKHPTVIEKEIAELKTLIKKESEYCESLDIASQVMTDAFAKVRESFGSALGQRTAEIFSSITNGKYKNVSVSKSFNLAVEETDVFGSNDWQSLSDGTIDQAYFALRLTVSEFLSKDGEKLPLILDDPFDRYDDARAEKAMEFLSEYAKESQALIFTCHKLFTEKYPFITLK